MHTILSLKPWGGDESALLKIKEIYLGSFPEAERRPWIDLESRARQERGLRLWILSSKGEAAGFLTAWDMGAFIYIEHFATDPAMRGVGMGAWALGELANLAGKPLVVEVERPDDSPLARRRIGFYERCGFHILDGFDYVQPPYSPGLPSVPLLLMATDTKLDPSIIARDLHAKVYGRRPKCQK